MFKSFLRKLIKKYRFVILDPINWGHKISFKISILQVFFSLMSTLILLGVIGYAIIQNTDLEFYLKQKREIQKEERELKRLSEKIEKLEWILDINELYLKNYKRYLSDKNYDKQLLKTSNATISSSFIRTFTSVDNIEWKLSPEELALRKKIEKKIKNQF